MESKLRVGIAGPVGSGKTAIIQRLCENLKDRLEIAVVTNDIYTQEDAKFLTNSKALAPERIKGVETGGCPHTAIREDCSINHVPTFLKKRSRCATFLLIASLSHPFAW